MDIAALSMVSSQSSAQNAAGIMVLKKAMNTMDQTGQAVVNLIQTATPALSLPHLGQNIDINA